MITSTHIPCKPDEVETLLRVLVDGVLKDERRMLTAERSIFNEMQRDRVSVIAQYLSRNRFHS